jgi:hypothetical protein
MIYIFGLAFAVAVLIACQIKRAPLNPNQNAARTKTTTFKVASQRRIPEAASMSDAAVRVTPRAPGFGKRTRD